MRTFLKYLFCLLCFGFINWNSCKAQGIITTIAGDGITQYIGDGGPADSFSLALPKGICVDKKGKVYIADYAGNRIRTVYEDTLRTIVGDSLSGDTGDGGLADTATLRNPDGVCMDTAGNIYITEWYHDLIRKVDAHTGIISTVCGVTGGGYGGDGGLATAARLNNPGGACTDVAGNIYIPDYNNHRIRRVSIVTGTIFTIAGTGVNGYSGDGALATNATLSYPNSICADSTGNIYFSEFGNNTIRRIDAVTGIITTVAGTGSLGYSGDGGLAIHAQLAEPNAVFIDRYGYLYISDYNNNVIRLVTPTGYMFTIAGSGAYGYTGDGGPPHAATFRGPTGVCVDDLGYIYIADGFNSVIRKMSPVVALNVGIKAIEVPAFDVYPNPSTGKFTITSGEQGAATIRVVNMVGQCILTTSFTGKQVGIDLSGYAAGMYFVQYSSSDREAVLKIITR